MPNENDDTPTLGEGSAGVSCWISFGETPDGRMVSIADAASGLACGLRCAACGERLVAKKGDKVRHHFAHAANAECAGAEETMLHKLAKQIIAEARRIWIPALVAQVGAFTENLIPPQWTHFDSVGEEVWLGGLRPDIIGHRRDRRLAIEVKVTHACGPEKLRLLEERELSTIEIDLSQVRAMADFSRVRRAVLGTAPRRWLFHPQLAAATARLEAIAAEKRAEAEAAVAREREAARQAEQERERKIAEDRLAYRVQRLRELTGPLPDNAPAWGDYVQMPIGDGPSPMDLIRDDGGALSRFQVRLIAVCRWFRNGDAAVPTDEDLAAVGLSVLRNRRDLIAAKREELAREREAEQVRLKAVAEAMDQRMLAKFRAEIGDAARKALGIAVGNEWMATARPYGGGPPIDGLTSLPDPAPYWALLRDSVDVLRRREAAKATARKQLEKAVASQFRSPQEAAAWMNGTNPALGFRKPIDVCAEPGGIERCRSILSPRRPILSPRRRRL